CPQQLRAPHAAAPPSPRARLRPGAVAAGGSGCRPTDRRQTAASCRARGTGGHQRGPTGARATRAVLGAFRWGRRMLREGVRGRQLVAVLIGTTLVSAIVWRLYTRSGRLLQAPVWLT